MVLLFGSGKLVCTGARRPSDVSRAVEKITKELQDAGLLHRTRSRASTELNPAPRKSRSSVAVPPSRLSAPVEPSEASAPALVP